MDHPPLQGVPWDLVAIKLDLLLHSFPSPVTPFDSNGVAWSDLPASLAKRGLLLRGMPEACIQRADSYVRDDRVHDDLFRWSNEKLQALDNALRSNTLTVVAREPLSRRVLFEFVDAHGNVRDSTLGFSEDWQLRNMFTEQIYQARTASQLRTMNIDSILPILRNANLTTTHIPWASLPSKMWGSGQYMSGLPRICLPTIIGDKCPSDAATPSTNWRKEQRVALQRCLDSGLLRILPRPAGSNVIFEVLEPNGSLVKTDCGFSDTWKSQHTPVPNKEKKAAQRKAARESRESQVPAAIPTAPWPQFHPTPSYRKKMDVTEKYMGLLRDRGLLIDLPDGPAWIYVPQMLATKGLYVSGIPRICLPLVREDDVVANFDPRQWSEAAQDAFIQALGQRLLHVYPATRGQRILYNVLEANGDLTDDCLGFSDDWCKKNLDRPDISTASPSVYVIEMWLDMLDSVGIPCHDLSGRRRIQWLQLPLLLAHRRLYISGCPLECMPVAQDDVVLELSSPYFYNDHQVALMRAAFAVKQVSVRPRASHRNALFVIEDNAGSMDFTCGFTSMWIQMNLHTVPSSLVAPLAPPSIALPNGPFQRSLNPGPTGVQPATTNPSQSLNNSNNPHQRHARSLSITKTAYPTPTDSAPASPMSLPPVTSQQKPAEESSRSLKIIIPAFKRRHLFAKPGVASTSSSPPPPLIKGSTTEAGPSNTPPQPASPTFPPTTQSDSAPAMRRYAVPSRRSTHRSPRRHQQLPVASPPTSDTEDNPGTFGPRESMSPRLPPVTTLPDPLPPVPVPTFLPKPGGNLRWDVEKYAWELTISELWPPDEWRKVLPVFPARLFWNAAQKVWLCEPSRSLTVPEQDNVGLSPAVRAALHASTRDGDLDPVEDGLSIIWHRWRRSWGLFEYVPQKLSPS